MSFLDELNAMQPQEDKNITEFRNNIKYGVMEIHQKHLNDPSVEKRLCCYVGKYSGRLVDLKFFHDSYFSKDDAEFVANVPEYHNGCKILRSNNDWSYYNEPLLLHTSDDALKLKKQLDTVLSELGFVHREVEIVKVCFARIVRKEGVFGHIKRFVEYYDDRQSHVIKVTIRW